MLLECNLPEEGSDISIVILLKNPMNASTRLSMNGDSTMISTAPPFVLRLSKDERRLFQQRFNYLIYLLCGRFFFLRALRVLRRDTCLVISAYR